MALTAKQVRIRRPRLTPSTGAGFLGFNPYSSPRQTWDEHLGHVPREANDQTEMGGHLEEGIARAGASKLKIPWEIVARPRELLGSADPDDDTLIDPELDWLCGTPDFLIDEHPAIPGEQSGMQIKNHEPHMTRTYPREPGELGLWDNGSVPAQYLIQCQMEIVLVSHYFGRDVLCWHLAAYFGGGLKRVRVYRIRRDEELQAMLLENGYRFWREHIDPNGPMREPDDGTWRARPAKAAQKRPKLNPQEILAAPMPEAPGVQRPAAELARDFYDHCIPGGKP